MPGSGTKLGPYEILQKIGAGGMGEVYRARDPRIGRDVAIKLISSSVVTTKEKLHRFEQEARATGALNHPNILSIYDFGTSDGSPYVVTELLEGETLRKRLTSGTLPVRKVIDYAIQIAQGLTAAHGKGIVHRDLKPENIFITKDGRVKILDFGLAKLTHPDRTNPDEHETISRITDAGVIVGTVAYMSPEQIRGNEVDNRSDLFTFGIILYEMLSGKRPFAGHSNIETMNAILQEDPADVSSTNPGVSPALDQIIHRCLEKEPHHRFQSTSDLTFALQALSVSGSLPIKKTVPVSNKMGLIAILLVIVAITTLYLLQKKKSSGASIPQIRSLAVLPLVNLTGDPQQEYFADGMTESLISDLARVKALKVISRTSMMQYKQRKKSIPEIAKELKVDAVVEGSVMRSGDRVRITAELIHATTDVHLWGESYERDLRDVLGLQKDVARSIVREIRIKVTPQEQAVLKTEPKINPAAYEAYLKGQFFFWKDCEKSQQYFQEAIDKEPEFALAQTYLASIYAECAGDILPLAEGLKKSRVTINKALQIDNSLAIAHAVSGDIYSYEWKWVEAANEMKRSIELDPNCSDCYFSYAAFYKHLGRFEDAIAMNKRAIDLDPLNRPLVTHLGYLYLKAHRYDEMDATCRAAQELSSDYYECWWQVLGNTMQGKYDKAISQMESFPGSKDNLVDSGWVYGMAGRRKQALMSLNKLIALSKNDYVNPLSIATVYAGMGEKDRAFEWLEKAYAARNHILGDLKSDPRLEPLHSDPRFKDLVRRVGIPD